MPQLTAMSPAVIGADVFSSVIGAGWLFLTTLLVIAAFVLFTWGRWQTEPPRPAPAEVVETLRGESPAVVNMLTNDATVTAAGLRATVIDLAARGWLAILPPEAPGDLARVRPAAEASRGDALRPHERLVLQHVIARFTDQRAVPAQYLAVDIRGPWWRRFAALVADEAKADGLVTRRWTQQALGLPAVVTALAALTWWIGARTGSDVAVIDSVERRIAAWVLLGAIVVMVVRLVLVLVRPTFTLTDNGVTAAREWLAVRASLDQIGFAELTPSDQDIGDRRLAYSTAMCLATSAAVELPLAREDHYRAWSNVGGRARLVRVTYPSRFGFGMAPGAAIAVGLVSWFVGIRLRRWSDDVAREQAFPWIYEQFPAQTWLIQDIATVVTILSFLPIVAGLWLAIAGAADVFGTVERTGVVVRARRPVEVSPLPHRLRRQIDREHYRIFLAVDDGTSDDVVACRATERTAVPQGARATVKSSIVLGRVRSALPVGHRIVE
jgi:hypothetical protein